MENTDDQKKIQQLCQLLNALEELAKYITILTAELETASLQETACKMTWQQYHQRLANRRKTRNRIRLLQKLLDLITESITYEREKLAPPQERKD